MDRFADEKQRLGSVSSQSSSLGSLKPSVDAGPKIHARTSHGLSFRRLTCGLWPLKPIPRPRALPSHGSGDSDGQQSSALAVEKQSSDDRSDGRSYWTVVATEKDSSDGDSLSLAPIQPPKLRARDDTRAARAQTYRDCYDYRLGSKGYDYDNVTLDDTRRLRPLRVGSARAADEERAWSAVDADHKGNPTLGHMEKSPLAVLGNDRHDGAPPAAAVYNKVPTTLRPPAAVERKVGSVIDPQLQSPLLTRLPQEVRERVYRFVLGGNLFHLGTTEDEPFVLQRWRCEYDDQIVRRHVDCREREINRIVREAGTQDKISLIAPLLSCWKTYLEASHILYTANVLDFNQPFLFLSLDGFFTPRRIHCIRSLRMQIPIDAFRILQDGVIPEYQHMWSQLCGMEGLRELRFFVTESQVDCGYWLGERMTLPHELLIKLEVYAVHLLQAVDTTHTMLEGFDRRTGTFQNQKRNRRRLYRPRDRWS